MTIKGLDTTAGAAAVAHKPAHFSLEHLIRPNILSLEPYRCARDDYQSGILLDANENSLGHSLPPKSVIPHNPGTSNGGATPVASTESDDSLSLNRYPDPGLFGIKGSLAELRGVPNDKFVFLGVGSDEVLDLIQRVCCRPGKDKILICPPTYGMYSVCAAVNDLEVVKVPLITQGGKFALDTEAVNIKLSTDPDIKITFICSPGNPTGTLIPPSEVRKVLDNASYKGLVVVDEAYIDFAEEEKRMGKRSVEQIVSSVSLVHEYQNVMVTQTLSKAFGLAAIRLGIAFAQPALVQIMNNTKAPYNISSPTAHLASLALSPTGIQTMRKNVQTLITNRDWLIQALETLPGAGEILGGNQANFVLVQMLDLETGTKPDNAVAQMVYKRMAEEMGLVVRNRSKDLGCVGCLRITVGTEHENQRCIELIKDLLQSAK
ncbi:probable histidinol-phosphate transaminase [Melanopsichium pennsylvanicum]|uniref:histidinol-phosphate transaminase n=2 Tax=Melanopsichium pennsylvanicum TaxID=63383 RepID=A0AAJ5C4Z3_9BASI|nr:probable histidinol-phosphate transaminase [Melanopsichium pennsylvanicum 4]SNX84028.1 probable histidinol-phosphate transaminase [Melanopsichium pennsylvanicum]